MSSVIVLETSYPDARKLETLINQGYRIVTHTTTFDLEENEHFHWYTLVRSF